MHEMHMGRKSLILLVWMWTNHVPPNVLRKAPCLAHQFLNSILPKVSLTSVVCRHEVVVGLVLLTATKVSSRPLEVRAH